MAWEYEYIWLIAFWTLFGVAHSILAAEWFKNRVKRLAGSYFRYYRPFYSALFTLYLLWIVFYQFSIPVIWLWRVSLPLILFSAILTFAGATAMVISIRKYFYYLSGIDVFIPSKEPGKVLEKNGLHRFVRHPLYAATLFTLWSLLIAIPSVAFLVTCIMVTLYTWLGIIPEEKKLKREFGWEYELYKRQVPMLIPFLKPRSPFSRR